MTRYALTALLWGGCSLVLAAPDSPPVTEPALPPLGADLSQTTVSGISSGGFMAAQLGTAYSASLTGVGVVAAGPYHCAGSRPALGLFRNATTTCMSPSLAAVAPDATRAWKDAQAHASANLIDPVANLRRQSLYAFSGSGDSTVRRIVVDTLEQYYLLAGVAPERIKYDVSTGAGHAFITDKGGDVPCAMTREPFINNCGFDQAATLLRHLYRTPNASSNQDIPLGKIVSFDQSAFFSAPRASMDRTAYVYVPKACREQSCAVHIALHGCKQGAALIGARFYGGVGYNEYADNNQLIILYPQAVPSAFNPNGCWDFWGYSTPPDGTGQPPFHAKGAPQMAAIMAMVARLGMPRPAPAAMTTTTAAAQH